MLLAAVVSKTLSRLSDFSTTSGTLGVVFGELCAGVPNSDVFPPDEGFSNGDSDLDGTPAIVRASITIAGAITVASSNLDSSDITREVKSGSDTEVPAAGSSEECSSGPFRDDELGDLLVGDLVATGNPFVSVSSDSLD